VATASRVDTWILVEYRGRWDRDLLTGSVLSEPLKEHLRDALDRLPRSRLLFIKRPDRRGPRRRMLYVASSRPGKERLHALEFDHHDDLLGLDLAALGRGTLPGVPVDHPLLVVCTHGKRDRCCARYGRPLFVALRPQVDPAWAWQSTHVGGDRFAANLVVLPQGLYFGWVENDDLGGILREHERGRIRLKRYRGRSSYPFPVQAAERAVRAKTRLRGLADLELLEAKRGAGEWRIRFAVDRRGEEHELVVRSRHVGEERYLTCESAQPRQALHCAVVSHTVQTG
jgi:hypothetical protein